MIDVASLPDKVQADLVNYVQDNPSKFQHESAESAIRNMSPREAVNAYLEWNGISGYTDDFIQAVFGIFAAAEHR